MHSEDPDDRRGSPAWLPMLVLAGGLLSGYGVCVLLAWCGRIVLRWIG